MTANIRADRKAFKQALRKLALITPRKSSIPVLRHIKVTGHHDHIVLCATDLDRHLVIKIDGSGSGSFLIELEPLAKAVSAARSEHIEISAAAMASVHFGEEGATDLRTLDVDNWPRLAGGVATAGFTVPAQELGWALERCLCSISNQETRYYLNGTYLAWLDFRGYTGLACRSTDGHRLTHAQVPEATAIGPSTGPQKISALIPKLACHVLVKLITPAPGDDREEYTETATVRQTDTHWLHVDCEGWSLSTRLIEGTFPDANRVFPGLYEPTRFETDTGAFLAALKRLSAIGSKVVLSVPRPGILEMHAGDAVETLDAETTGQPRYIGANASYLREAAEMADGPTVSIAWDDYRSPMLFDMPDHDGHLLHVLMPTRVDAPKQTEREPVKAIAPPQAPKQAAKPRSKGKPVAPAPDAGVFTPVR